jgi:hypothetical protein
MATPDMVWLGVGQAKEVLTVASEALPSRRVGQNMSVIDTSVWQTWPWQIMTVPAGESLRGWFKDRDDEGRLLFMAGGGDFFLFHAQDVKILTHGPDADLSLAWDIEKA